MKPLHIAILLVVIWIISPKVFSAFEELILSMLKMAIAIVGNAHQLPIGNINLP